MDQVKQHAKKLAIALKESTEFEALETAYESVMQDPDAKAILEKYRSAQKELQEKNMQGVEITEADVEEANKVAEEVQQNKQLYNLIAMEQILHDHIGEISKIINGPLEEMYEKL